MKKRTAELILKDSEKFAHHDRVFLNNPVVMQGMGLAPLVVVATTGQNSLMLAAAVANLLMLSTTAQPIEQDEAVAEKLTQTYVTHMPEPVIRQEEPERDMSAWTDAATYIAKTVYGEAMVCGTTERAAVVWCILNRADDARDATPAGVIAVVTKPYQFHGYAADHPLLPELEELALDVIERWLDEKDGKADTGRVLPREYLFFTGDGEHNHFRTEWDGGQVWDWSLQSPYEE